MPMIYVTVAGETFGIKTAKQEAMLHRMEKNYGPFMTADTVPAEKVLFIADIDRTVTVPAGEPLKTFDYALTEDPLGSGYIRTAVSFPSRTRRAARPSR